MDFLQVKMKYDALKELIDLQYKLIKLKKFHGEETQYDEDFVQKKEREIQEIIAMKFKSKKEDE